MICILYDIVGKKNSEETIINMNVIHSLSTEINPWRLNMPLKSTNQSVYFVSNPLTEWQFLSFFLSFVFKRIYPTGSIFVGQS